MTNAEARRPRTDTSTPLDDDELTELMDQETWDWDNALTGVPAPNPTLTIGVRLNADDARILGDAARAANMPLSRYIELIALETAKRARKVRSGHDRSKEVA